MVKLFQILCAEWRELSQIKTLLQEVKQTIAQAEQHIIMSNKEDLDALEASLNTALDALSERIGALTPENLEAEKAALQADIDRITALAPGAKP